MLLRCTDCGKNFSETHANEHMLDVRDDEPTEKPKDRHDRHTFFPEFPPLSDEDKERVLKDLDERFEKLKETGIVMPVILSTPHYSPSWYKRLWYWLTRNKTPRAMSINEITCKGPSFAKTGKIDWVKGVKYLPRKDSHDRDGPDSPEHQAG